MFSLWQGREDFRLLAAGATVALSIDRRTGSLKAVSPPHSGGRQIAAFLGSLQLRTSQYLVVALTKVSVGRIAGHELFALSQYQLIPLLEGGAARDSAERELVALAAAHLRQATLFWSPTLDLTTSLQRTSPELLAGPDSAVEFNKSDVTPLFERADERFWWNKYVATEITAAAFADSRLAPYVCVAIYGVVSLQTTYIHGTAIEFGVISRRSVHRAGTRYFRRGIDADGNVANFNETEQILQTKTHLYSFLQTRGSVPARWSEVNGLKYRPKLKVGPAALESARKHFTQQEELYGDQYLVNLVNQSGYEKPVKEAYETVVDQLQDKKLHYIYFDFHHECSKMRWHRVQLLVDTLLDQGFDNEKWFAFDLEKKVQTQAQSSVVRTNCMDCLDRTNVVQSTLGGYVLQQQLQEAQVLTPSESWQQDERFLALFRAAWADNADGVSRAYSGTGALKTDFTRLGKRTRKGAFQDLRNSINRYWLNNYKDGPRQDGFSLFLGDWKALDARPTSPFLDQRPLTVQAIPYIFTGSLFVFLLSALYPSKAHSARFNVAVSLFFFAATAISGKLLLDNGLQYVNWPKLMPLDFLQWDQKTNGWRVSDDDSTSLLKHD